MPYTQEEGGRLNNFAAEPKMYVAEPPSKKEQRNYIIAGAAALALVSGVIFIAFSIS
ncbi:ssl1498 family light-harvesting-like protein [Spirulina subsalsa FACHB-351]|uniref:Ssl1498 family light-harvesting-like protein n=1 Tax=Spirulina subsalsa FACHB-351 TaxID=234711 RepID=A0ABT3L5L7_9CYAN|nr:ssl1498 family light-harvesting-like protein [Spirulina subsalsa]MCW6036786.1 ssl1498 family light-harvesting-like protein [Spirulina subsalsa FACHB-351]